jgi:small subunit ribosomal protein S2
VETTEKEMMNQEETATDGPPISMRALLEAGVHFGHNAGRWNPKMKPYIFGARNGIHIIDLQHTVKLFGTAFQAVVDCAARGEKILFVGTKKEGIMLQREKTKLVRALGGIKEMSKLPGLMFVVDPNKEHIAVKEARKLDIPVVAITDTNCNPEFIDYVIPGNDDAIRAIKLFTARIADAALIGAKLNKERNTRQLRESVPTAEKVIHVSSGGDGPRVEISSGGSSLTSDATAEASASPEVAPAAEPSSSN